MRYSLLLAVAATGLLAGCSKSNDFSPSVGMSGEAIFKAACEECHQADDAGYYFELDAEVNIPDRVLNGGLMMPSFPNIQGEALRSLEEYVTSHSRMAQ